MKESENLSTECIKSYLASGLRPNPFGELTARHIPLAESRGRVELEPQRLEEKERVREGRRKVGGFSPQMYNPKAARDVFPHYLDKFMCSRFKVVISY